MALAVRNVTKAYGALVALDDVSFECQTGRIVGVVGENGAGKSTLMGVLAGFLRPDRGVVVVDGVDQHFDSTLDAFRAGVAMVYQHSTLFPSLSVVENLRLAPARAGRRGRHDEDTLSRYHLSVPPGARVGGLPLSQQLHIELARALEAGSRYLILDEPTAALDPPAVERLTELLRRLRDEGTGIVFVSHKLPEVLELADEVVVMRDGRPVLRSGAKEVEPATLANAMSSAPVEEIARTTTPPPIASHEPVELVVEGLELIEDEAAEPLSFTARSGEVLGILGVGGNGQQELAEALVGLAARPGRIFVRGLDQAARFGYVPGDRHEEGLFLDARVWENVLLTGPSTGRLGIVGKDAIEQLDHLLASQFGLPQGVVHRRAAQLSGGQQQRVLLARVLRESPDVLVAVYPTRGLDVHAQAFVHSAIREFSARGRPVVALLGDVDEALSLCDRIAVIYRHRLVGETASSPTERARLGEWMAGIGADSPTAVGPA